MSTTNPVLRNTPNCMSLHQKHQGPWVTLTNNPRASFPFPWPSANTAAPIPSSWRSPAPPPSPRPPQGSQPRRPRRGAGWPRTNGGHAARRWGSWETPLAVGLKIIYFLVQWKFNSAFWILPRRMWGEFKWEPNLICNLMLKVLCCAVSIFHWHCFGVFLQVLWVLEGVVLIVKGTN